jgi:aerobic carbon-monoxide dehydrogenase small subunit
MENLEWQKQWFRPPSMARRWIFCVSRGKACWKCCAKNCCNCGACNVILNGVLVNSCLVLAVEANGASVTTVEGLATPERLHPLQQKFLEHAALQCGICTPGFLVSAKALLDKNPDPTEHDVRLWLAGNLCRCTGYDKIVRAVLDAADSPEMQSVA